MEKACNDTFCQVFTCHLTEDINKLVAVNDDKAILATMSGTKYKENLKFIYYASDKHIGFKCRLMVAICSGMPIFICWERNGDITIICYAEMVKEIFGNGCELNAFVFTEIMFYSDCSYWIQSSLFGLLLKYGK